MGTEEIRQRAEIISESLIGHSLSDAMKLDQVSRCNMIGTYQLILNYNILHLANEYFDLGLELVRNLEAVVKISNMYSIVFDQKIVKRFMQGIYGVKIDKEIIGQATFLTKKSLGVENE